MVHTTGSAGGFDFSPNSEHPLLPLKKVKRSVNGYDGRSGVAGSLDASIDIRVIVVSTDAVQHDYDLTPLGYAPGTLYEIGSCNSYIQGGKSS